MRKYPNQKIVDEYVNSILLGKKHACKKLVKACQRFQDDLKNTNYDFNPKPAEFVIKIIENTWIHIKGDLKNSPFLLEPWQKFIVYNIFGFFYKGTDERRYKEAFIYIPRKNGKTTFIAALSFATALLERNTAATIYIVGNVLKQALESFDIILKNIKAMGEEENFRVLDNNSEHSIFCSFFNDDGIETGSIKIEALASNPDSQDGYNCNIAICDEVHAYKNPNQYYVIRQAMKAYRNKLMIAITTAGEHMNYFCYKRYLYCGKILERSVQKEDLFIFICEADNPDDYTNPIEHEKANPNYGISIRPKDILSDSLEAQNDPVSRNQFLNKSLNIYTNALDVYFNIEEVQASDKCYNWNIEDLLKLPIKWYGGADLSKLYDLTAGCIYGTYNDIDIAITHGFIPRTQAYRKAEEDNIPFFWWEEQKWLTICNSEVVEYEEIVKWFMKMRELGFKIVLVGYDRYQAREFYQSMINHKFRLKDQDQAYWKKSEGFRRIELKIKEKKFYYLHNAAFEYCIGNVKGIEDSSNRIRYEKVSPTQRMDFFDVSVIACKQNIEGREKNKKISEWFD